MIKLLTAKLGVSILAVIFALTLFLWQSNRLLSEKTQTLKKSNKEQIQTITTQKKVLAVVKNIKPNSLAGNIKRMQDDQL